MFCFFNQKTAYEVRFSDWSSDVCSSDLCPLMSSAPVQPAICTWNITGDGAYLPKGPNATRFGSVSEGVPRLRQGAVRPAGARVLRDDGAVASAVRGCVGT